MTTLIPIPQHLSKDLSTRSFNILRREQIQSCQKLLTLQENDLCRIQGSGSKTVAELRCLQQRILQEYPQLLPSPEPGASSRTPSRVRVEKHTGESTLAVISETGPAAGPAGWSVLNRTLSDLFPLPAASCRAEPGNGYGALGLPAADLERLRSFAIFPEDSFLLLFSVSTGYLLETGLSDSAISTMLCALANSSGLPGAALQSTLVANVPDESLYAGLPSDLLDPLVVPDFLFPELLDTANDATGAVPWSAVAKITERAVVRRLGLSVTALRAVRYLWQLQERAVSIAKSAAAGLPTAAYRNFCQLADRYLEFALVTKYGPTQHPGEVERCRRVLRGRLRLLDGRKVPLRKLGEFFGVTKQRILQVEQELLANLKSPATLRHLDYLWHLLDRLMVSGGGGRYARELCLSLQRMHGWSTPPSEEALASLMELSPRYRVVWDAPIRVALTSPCCIGCETSTPVIFSGVKTAARCELSFDHALEAMLNVCDRERCPELRKVASFSRSLFHFMADSTPELVAHDEALRLGDPNSHVREVLEEIVLSAVDGMHFKEVSRRFNLAVPGKAITAHNIHARLGSASWAALWGHGTFKHREFLSVPVPLITEILEDLAARLVADDIPYLCVNGVVFDRYAQRLQSHDVPNPPALYSCMRIVGSPTLAFGEYPYVLRKDAAGARPPIYLLLEKFISTRTRAVSAKELMAFALGKLGVPEIQVHAHFKLIPNTLRIGYLRLHLSNMPPVSDQLRKIVDDPPKRQAGAGTLKVRLFRKHQAACTALGITGPGQLVSLVEHFFPGRIDWKHLEKRGYTRRKKPEAKPDVEPSPRCAEAGLSLTVRRPFGRARTPAS